MEEPVLGTIIFSKVMWPLCGDEIVHIGPDTRWNGNPPTPKEVVDALEAARKLATARAKCRGGLNDRSARHG